MKGTTHVKIGLAATVAVATLVNTGNISLPIHLDMTSLAFMAGGAIVGSLLPDDDTKTSTIAKFLPISNRIITGLAAKGVKACYHRHLFHSLLFIPLITFLMGLNTTSTFLQTFLFGISLGSACHDLADAILSNTWLLYPIVKKPISLFHLKQAENEKLYKGIEKVCSALATIAFLFMGGNFLLTI